MARIIGKRIAEALAVRSGALCALHKVRGRPDVILAYHNVVPDRETIRGDSSLHLPRRRFAEQLEVLVNAFETVSLHSLWEVRPKGARPPRAAITFDDAYQGVVEHAVPELVRRGLPATIFVVPAFASGRAFWWDQIAAGAGGIVPEAVRWTALEVFRGEHERIMEWVRAAGVKVVDRLASHMAAASEDELAAACSQPGITLGSHSWSHACLPALTCRELAAELEKPLAWLQERFGSAAIPWLSYPYGRSTETVQRAAELAGYLGALGITGGPLPRGAPSMWALPRLNVPSSLSQDGFVLKLSGITPA